ncbi:hypothetical protein METBIDRAFT_14028 [Metschnikowia bicuspidata var. bicuspidata NRRL YB-4993]|uniref:Checkpoint protein n=1 Tax=Metschnikowia bicuspidata var. bicuspidata NRRL YB-4993 TaxID=869754 RepID=A0A1A0GZ55_9ASCO|nr:hypothetical protein METBIDRAFT_14028 [Metschnikowia bicuspidata var. bicuspidata NRRL YB-4993]OBA17036.1 hypothetical protein METBIDRAFT_14028 [Metschnikowia bicuspidata var. bicuspidata NRRL YB-4993]
MAQILATRTGTCGTENENTASSESMKLKLETQSSEVLKNCFSLINTLRKRVILRFSPEQLLAILINDSSLNQEPQIWCKFPMRNIFLRIEIQSLRDNWILLEINIELFLQALRNFDKASSTELKIRLQKKEGQKSSGSAYLALQYSDITENSSTINHVFRIPVRILKEAAGLLKEPVLPRIDLMIKLPNEFFATYRRLERFKNSTAHEKMTISASQRNGGTLKFVLQEADSCNTTIKWNGRLDIQVPPSDSEYDSLRAAALQESPSKNHEDRSAIGVDVTVNLKEWCLTAKIVGTCQTVILFICDNNACAIHCLLDETDDAEIIYYISGIRQAEPYSD